jgi:hypothetical protein
MYLNRYHRYRLALGGITLPGMIEDPGSFSGMENKSAQSGVAAGISEPQIHFVLAPASFDTSSCAPSSRATGVSFFAENRSTR